MNGQKYEGLYLFLLSLYLMFSVGCGHGVRYRNCDEEPAWSPDGYRIAFYRDPNRNPPVPFGEEDSSGIWILDLETMDAYFLTKGRLPDWSPDGKWIAYVYNRNIYKINVETKEIKQLTTWGSCFFPDWALNGKLLAFDFSYHTPSFDSFGIWILNLIDNTTKHLGGGREPDWHPGGNILTFIGVIDSVGGIYAADTNGYNVRLIVKGGYSPVFLYSPVFSPDGSKIAYVSERDQRRNIYVIDTLGENKIQLTDVACAVDPSWSPDGSKIVFSQRDEEAMTMSLWIMNSDGSEKRRMTWPDD